MDEHEHIVNKLSQERDSDSLNSSVNSETKYGLWKLNIYQNAWDEHQKTSRNVNSFNEMCKKMKKSSE